MRSLSSMDSEEKDNRTEPRTVFLKVLSIITFLIIKRLVLEIAID